MRRLILLRHAKTERDAPSGEDHDRRLDQRGETDSRDVAVWLTANGYRPDLALVSTAARARQTWDLLAPHMPDARVDYRDALYNADALDIQHLIRDLESDPAVLMVVAHNPGLHELAWRLIGQGDQRERDELAHNLPTAGTVIVDFAGPWRKISPHSGTLRVFTSPKRLRLLSDARD